MNSVHKEMNLYHTSHMYKTKLFQFAHNVLTKMNCVEEGMNLFQCAHIKWDLGRVPLAAPLNRGLKAQLGYNTYSHIIQNPIVQQVSS